MSTRYILTCECGEQITVEARQAGRKIECSCGTIIDIPPLMAMRQLPMVDEDELAASSRPIDRRAENVGSQLVLLLVGLGILIVGTGGVIYVWLDRPAHPLAYYTDEFLENRIQTLTPVLLDDYWTHLRSFGVYGHKASTEDMEIYEHGVMMNNIWLSVTGLIACVGLGLAILAISSGARHTPSDENAET